jgi:hypothetical protein
VKKYMKNCLRVISGAYRATPIRNLEVEVRVPPLGIHLDSLKAQFRVKLEESEVAGMIREAVGKVEKHLDVGQGGSGRRKRGRRLGGEERNPGDSSSGIAVPAGRSKGERGGTAMKERGRVVKDGHRMAHLGLPQRTQHHPNKANFLEPFNGFQMTIHATI